jgi:hypothetical protein
VMKKFCQIFRANVLNGRHKMATPFLYDFYLRSLIPMCDG